MDNARDRDRGTTSTEFAVIFGAFVLFTMTVLVAGTIAQTEIDIRNAAQEAARAATLERNPTDAEAAAIATATNQTSKCEPMDVEVDTTGFEPGGIVTVIVTCTAHVLFGDRTMTASASEIIDTFRGT